MIYHLDHDAGITFGSTSMPLVEMIIQVLFDEAVTDEEFASAMYEQKRPVVLVFPYDETNEKYNTPIGITNMNFFPFGEDVEDTPTFFLSYVANIYDIDVRNEPPFKWYNGRIVAYNSLEKDYMIGGNELLPELSEDVIMQYAPWSENTPEVNAGTGDS